MGRGERKPLSWDTAPRKLSPVARAEMELPPWKYRPGPESTFDDVVQALAKDLEANFRQVSKRALQMAKVEGVTLAGNPYVPEAEISESSPMLTDRDLLRALLKPIFLELLRDPECRAALRESAGVASGELTRQQLRLKKGWTAEQLSQETGRLISPATIGLYENGTVKGLGVRNMAGFTAMCKALGVTREKYLTAATSSAETKNRKEGMKG